MLGFRLRYCAGMNAFQSITLALFARSQNGMGRIIDVSLYHALADWMNVLTCRPVMATRHHNALAATLTSSYGALNVPTERLFDFNTKRT